MSDETQQKLDRILKILDKQQMDSYIPVKWKSVVDYLEDTGRTPQQVLEFLIGVDALFKDQEERLKREGKE